MPFGPWPGAGGGGGGAWPGNGGAPPAIGAASAAGGAALTSSSNHTHKAAPISTVYVVGAALADQTAAILDANGGGIVLDGTGAGNTLGPVLTLKGSGGLTDAPAIIDGGDIAGRALHLKSGATTIAVDSPGGLGLSADLVSMDVPAGRGFQVDATTNLALGFQSALAAAAINGFGFLRSMPAPPTGVPASSYGSSATAMSARVFNTRDHDANDWDPVARTWIPSQAVARWPAANTRWYAIDGALGDDKNVGFSDVSSAAAGLVAKKTFAGLAQIFPLNGANRKAVIVIASGTYVGGLQVFLAGCSGYAADFPLILPTITNATAGAVAFAGDVNDKLMAGFVTATGMNAAGYNPVAPFDQVSIKCLKVGGAAPGFPAETAAPIPMGVRGRFDSATTTAALRNVSFPIVGISAADTLTGPNVATGAGFLPVAPVGTDTFYIEMAGLNVDQTLLGNFGNQGNTALASHNSAPPQIVGVNFGTSISVRNTPLRLIGCIGTLQTNAPVSTNFFFHDEAGTSRTVGCGMRVTVGQSVNSPVAINHNDSNQIVIAPGAFTLTEAIVFNIANGAFFAAGLTLTNCLGDVTGAVDTAQTTSLVGGRTSNAQSPVRIRGTAVGPTGASAGLNFNFSRACIGRLDISGMGASPCVRVLGLSSLTVTQFLVGTTGNNDVGMDLTSARGALIVAQSTPTVTGALGDVRLSDGTIITWAQAVAGVVDPAGNIIMGAATSPLHPIPVAAGAVAVAVTNAPAGSPATFARYFKWPDGAGGFITVGSLT